MNLDSFPVFTYGMINSDGKFLSVIDVCEMKLSG